MSYRSFQPTAQEERAMNRAYSILLIEYRTIGYEQARLNYFARVRQALGEERSRQLEESARPTRSKPVYNYDLPKKYARVNWKHTDKYIARKFGISEAYVKALRWKAKRAGIL